MAFPASRGALSDILEGACRHALQLKARAEQVNITTAAGSVASSYIIEVDVRLRVHRVELIRARDTADIGPYAQAQLGDGSLNVANEFNAMINALDGATNWIRTNFPTVNQSGTQYLAERTWGADGPVERLFTPAQTAGLRTALSALIATIS